LRATPSFRKITERAEPGPPEFSRRGQKTSLLRGRKSQGRERDFIKRRKRKKAGEKRKPRAQTINLGSAESNNTIQKEGEGGGK